MTILWLNTSEAACKGADLSLWFPDFVDEDAEDVFDDGTVFESYGDTAAYYDAARAVCVTCPMQQPCLDYAMEHRIRFGMYGGLTPIERRRIERRDRRKRLQDRRRQEAVDGIDLDPDLDFDDTVDE